MIRRIRVDLDSEEHDDELADFAGVADVALIALTVAMHVATIAMLHRSSRRLDDRTDVTHAAEIVLNRLRRRGGVAVADTLSAALPQLGEESFVPVLRAAAAQAAERIRAVPRRQLDKTVGRPAADELLEMGSRAVLSGGSLSADEAGVIAKHLGGAGEVVVGLGRGAVFLRRQSTRGARRFHAGKQEVRLYAPLLQPLDGRA